MGELRLGVDFGTSHTVGVLGLPDGRSQLLLFDGSPLLPSGVFRNVAGHLLTGRYAERSSRSAPERFEPNPKRRIDDGAVLLGDGELSVPDLIGAVLSRVLQEATRVAGAMPTRTTLTHPAGWAATRRSVLVEAARRAGLTGPELVAEPVAAADYFTGVLGHRVPDGSALVVYDLGGGTFDIAVVRRTGGGWEIVASDGLDDVGGVDLDSALVHHLGTWFADRDPATWQRLVSPRDTGERRHHRMLYDDARGAKEQLSTASLADLYVPLFDADAHVTREEFERLAQPWLERTVSLTTSTLYRSRLEPERVAGLFLVGGSSRIPLVATLLHRRLGIAPTVIEQPEVVVALGALGSGRGQPTLAGSAAPTLAGGSAAPTLPGSAPSQVGAAGPPAGAGDPAAGEPPTLVLGPAGSGAVPDPAGGTLPGSAGRPWWRRRAVWLAVGAAVIVGAVALSRGWFVPGGATGAGVTLNETGKRNAALVTDDDLLAFAGPWLNDTTCKRSERKPSYAVEEIRCEHQKEHWSVYFTAWSTEQNKANRRSQANSDMTEAAKQNDQLAWSYDFTATTPESGTVMAWAYNENPAVYHVFWDDADLPVTAELWRGTDQVSPYKADLRSLERVWQNHTGAAGR